jgi:hypothetical protein
MDRRKANVTTGSGVERGHSQLAIGIDTNAVEK